MGTGFGVQGLGVVVPAGCNKPLYEAPRLLDLGVPAGCDRYCSRV